MPNIALRNPQYKMIEVPASGVQSTKCTITIDGTVRYIIVRNITTDIETGANFDISELTRDYLNITYSSTNAVDTVSITTVLQNYSGQNATGVTVGSAFTFNDVGFEAYGLYTDGANPELPFAGRLLSTWLLAANVSQANVDSFEVFLPTGLEAKVVGMNSSGVAVVHTISSTDTSINVNDITPILKVNRIDCTKYGIGTQCVFINKFGVQQDLWFFLKNAKNINRRNEKYQSNTLLIADDVAAEYNITDAPTKVFNTNAKQTYKLSSGYYPEWAVEYFEQLLLSEYVWLRLPRNETPAAYITIPVTVKTSSMAIKTSVNDRLIEYTIEFEDAFDYINNIR
tara:strand:+ start:1391 stop:2413 length:1023 start_codon:yes stop_codon:yes gene_type:complete